MNTNALIEKITPYAELDNERWNDLMEEFKEIIKLAQAHTAQDIFKELKELYDDVKKSDKTNHYGYGKGKDSQNAYGQLPEGGKRWMTPRELMESRLHYLKQKFLSPEHTPLGSNVIKSVCDGSELARGFHCQQDNTSQSCLYKPADTIQEVKE